MAYLFTDFDGVLNVFNTKSQWNKHQNSEGLFGHLRRTSVSSSLGCFNILYSAELVRKLNALHDECDFTWLHLTTWAEEAKTLLDPRLGMESDGSIDWDAHTGVTNKNYLHVRAARKYELLKEHHNGEPFVWVDDEATFMFNADDFGNTPALVIATDPKWGITKADFNRIKEFMEENNA